MHSCIPLNCDSVEQEPLSRYQKDLLVGHLSVWPSPYSITGSVTKPVLAWGEGPATVAA